MQCECMGLAWRWPAAPGATGWVLVPEGIWEGSVGAPEL